MWVQTPNDHVLDSGPCFQKATTMCQQLNNTMHGISRTVYIVYIINIIYCNIYIYIYYIVYIYILEISIQYFVGPCRHIFNISMIDKA